MFLLIIQGYIKNGLAHGKGVYVQNDKYKYVGHWYQDQKHGKGEEFHPNGTEYKGKQQNYLIKINIF